MQSRYSRILFLLGTFTVFFTSQATFGEQRNSLSVPHTDNPPVIDGIINEHEWRDAASLKDLHQFEPDDHGTPTEPSTIWIKYDRDYLYVAARHTDSEPAKIVANQLMHGQSLQYDDAFEIILDPFDNGRSGYNFQTNPNGMRNEALYENTTELNRDWDTIWNTEARTTEDGWESEMAIPFKSINFDPNNSDWGFTVARTIARKREEIAWTSHGRQINPGTTGVLADIEGAEQGIGLDIVPSLVARALDEDDGAGSVSETEPSLDVFYKFTPSLTGVLTINTDFAATEADDREINLTRFGLFLPEKRDFFLQDADIFSFGGLQQENGMPFFSRRIGLSDDGEPLDISAGAKLTGRVGDLSVGLLGVRQDHALSDDNEDVFVGKLSYNLSEKSTIGAIFTSGDPLNEASSQLWGIDYRYRTPDLVPNGNVVVDAWFQQSDTEFLDSDDGALSIGLEVEREEGLRGYLWHKRIEKNFLPALGFVNRAGVEQTEVQVSFVKRFDHHLIRKYIPGFQVTEVSKIDGDLESRLLVVQPFLFIADRGDSIEMRLMRDREVIDAAFELVPGVIVGPGDYMFDSTSMEFETAQEREFAFAAEVTYGDFFDGDKLTYEARLDWRPNRHIYLGLEFEVNDGEVGGGEFLTRLMSLNANFAFNSKWSWANFIQYDNVSETAGINSRLRWNRRAGQDLYIVINQGFERDPDRGFLSTVSELSLKLSYAIRF